jgi:hypothetical protein
VGSWKTAHPQITAILNQQREEFLAVLRQLSPCCGLLASIPQESTPNSLTPFWKNDFFESLDAAALVGMLCAKRPARYVEIGSGNSTRFARYAIEQMHLRTSITSIDPEPRAIINSLCDTVVRRRLEDSTSLSSISSNQETFCFSMDHTGSLPTRTRPCFIWR